MGTYVGIHTGEFKGTITFEEGGEFIETTNNSEYKITIEYVGDKKPSPKDKNIIIHENQTDIYDFIKEKGNKK